MKENGSSSQGSLVLCLCLWFLTRDDQPRGGQESGQVLPDAAARLLPRGTVRDHVDVLEAEARGATHL